MFLYRARDRFAGAQQTGTGGVCMTRTGPVIFGFVVFALVGTCCYGPALAAADTAAEQSPAEKAAWSAPDQEAALKSGLPRWFPSWRRSWTSAACAASSGFGTWAWVSRTRQKAIFCWTAPSSGKQKTTTGRCASCTPSTPTFQGLRPVPPLSPRGRGRLGNHTLFGLPPGAFNADHPERLGLKAAYHQQCMDCHKQMNKGPIDCIGCHTKIFPTTRTGPAGRQPGALPGHP
jgi:hypothetical protein